MTLTTCYRAFPRCLQVTTQTVNASFLLHTTRTHHRANKRIKCHRDSKGTDITLKITEMDGRMEELNKDSCEAPHRPGRIHQAEMGRAPSENAPAVCARSGDGEEWGFSLVRVQTHLGCEHQKAFNTRLRERGFL